MRILVLSVSILALACTAAYAKPPSPPPSVDAAPGQAAPAQARFYADCIAQAATNASYDREPDSNLLRFTCTGDVARRFYDGLAAWSAKVDSGVAAEGRSFRFTQKIRRNPFGVDYCSIAETGGDPRCVVVLNVGEFLSFADTRTPGP